MVRGEVKVEVSGEALVRELLREGCVTVLTVDGRGDAARTRLYVGGDVTNFGRPDVIGSELGNEHIAAVRGRVGALVEVETRFAGLPGRRLARGATLAIAAAFASISLGLAEVATALWTTLAAALGWGVLRGGPRLVAHRAGRRLARRLLDEPS